jgi:hypothetical protein
MSGSHKLPIELACSMAGQLLPIPIPKGVVVLAERDQLPGLSGAAKPMPGSSLFLCFGSVHQWPDDTIARMLNDDAAADEFTWRQLCESGSAAPGAAWDELAANADRHTGNLVFDGAKYWFIDHELALQPIARMMRSFTAPSSRDRLLAYRSPANIVAGELVRRQPRNHELMSQPGRFTREEKHLKLLADKVRTWRTDYRFIDESVWPMTEVVLRGIALRLPALALMLGERLRLPNPDSLWNSSTNSR